jgi:CIC family chloride channel protein
VSRVQNDQFWLPLLLARGPSPGQQRTPRSSRWFEPNTCQFDPQAVFAGESLGQALRQLEVYGRDGLPVLSADGQRIEGWVTNTSVLQALARQLGAAQAETARAQLAADWGHGDLESALREPPSPLPGYRVAEVTIADGSPASVQRLSDVAWPAVSVPVTVLRAGRLRPADPGIVLRAGDRVSLLTPAPRTPGAAGGAALRPPPDSSREETRD